MEPSRTSYVIAEKLSNISRTNYLVVCFLACSVLPVLGLIGGVEIDYFDIPMYVNMTLDDFSTVTEPYASRVLAPFLARLLMHVSDLDARTSLLVVNVSAYYGFVSVMVLYLFHTRVPLYWALIICLLPYNFLLIKYIFVPDSVAVLLSFVVLFLIASQPKLPRTLFATSIFAMLARNTFIAVYAPIAVFNFWTREYGRAIALVLGCGAGLVILYLIVPDDVANIHQMSGVSYFILKLPANFITNVLGIDLYTNTYQWCTDPVAAFDVSLVPFIGSINEIGYCNPDLFKALKTFTMYFTIFGAWPILAITFLRKSSKIDQEWMLCFLFLVFFIAAPCLGKTVERLFLYSYPLLIVLTPYLIRRVSLKTRRRFIPATCFLQAIGLNFIYVYI